MPLNIQNVKWGRAAGGAGAALSHTDLACWLLTPPARIPAKSARVGLQAVLFDLDGVLVDTAKFHYQAWKRLADEMTLSFDEHLNANFRGVNRMTCLDLLLGEHARSFATEEKVILADRKNGYYLEQVLTLTPGDAAAGAAALLGELAAAGVRMAVVSASRNARLVLDLLHLTDRFDAIMDGNDVLRGKPHPEGFVKAAGLLRTEPSRCVVIEDGSAGIRAALAAGMASVGVAGARGTLMTQPSLVGVTLGRLETGFAGPPNR